MLALVSIVVALAALFGFASARWLKLPTTVGTMLLTLLLSIGLVLTARTFPGVHAWAMQSVLRIDFERFILHGLLSLLLFAGAFLLDLRYLYQERLAVALLAGGGTILSAAMVGLLIFYCAPFTGLHPSWIESLLFGALISPTDPIAVLEMLRRVSAPKYLQAQLAGESLFNDGVGAVLFLTLLGIAESGHIPSLGHVGSTLLLEAGGGLAIGVLLAWPVSRLMQAIDQQHIEILLTLAFALGGYALADHLHLSAPLEAVAAGLTLRGFNQRHQERISMREIEHFWLSIDEVQNAILFVLLGCEFLVVDFTWRTVLLGLLAILLVNVSRFTAVASMLGLMKLIAPRHQSSLLVLAWGGLRGGLSIALALSLPDRFGRTWILTATYTVVVFSIVIKGGTMDLFLKRFRSHITEVTNG